MATKKTGNTIYCFNVLKYLTLCSSIIVKTLWRNTMNTLKKSNKLIHHHH
jgi:hypothetical protein